MLRSRVYQDDWGFDETPNLTETINNHCERFNEDNPDVKVISVSNSVLPEAHKVVTVVWYT